MICEREYCGGNVLLVDEELGGALVCQRCNQGYD